ncbi:MAG: type II toxin-antitoxin system RelE/ParE family toxin [Ignavibacteria bacterium]|jgi:mRNA interferase RelE/StbE|nr:type II toxin-antitoxin system RelE/ParE family toxin [Ignavibacteria bacterium]
MYEIILPKSVQKELDKVADVYYSRISNKIFHLEIEPRPIGCVKLSDNDEYRIRVGKYRILYEINDKEKLIAIYKIAHRKEAYKKK